MSFVTEKYVYNLGNLSSLIRGTIDIKDWDVMWEGLSVYPFRTNKVPVNEASSCSTVQEGFNRVEFAGVCSQWTYLLATGAHLSPAALRKILFLQGTRLFSQNYIL